MLLFLTWIFHLIFLAQSTPPNTASQTAQKVPELKVTVREWEVPTPASKPYTTVLGPGGLIWFTEEGANKIGSVDPATGEIKEYSLAGEKNAAPHGLVLDHEGNVWYAASVGGFIGKLEPKTEKVVTYPMPDANVKDPENVTFDATGILWFTLPVANMIGKLDPTSGAVALKPVPTANARPNSIMVSKQNHPVFTESGTTKLGFVTPDRFAINEWPLPPGARSRRLAFASDQNTLYFTDSVNGTLGKMDLSIGAMITMASPGGPDSSPYGLAMTSDGKVWYTETGNQPNDLVRFDPAMSTFAHTTLPCASGNVHDLTATPEGRLFFTSNAGNKICSVEVAK